MRALINNKKEVMQIAEEIQNSNPNFGVVDIYDFQEGDEIDHYIIVNEVVEGIVTSYSAVKQSPYVRNLLEKAALIEQENTSLKLAMTEMAESHEQEKTEMQLALAELAELVGGEANHG